MISIKEALEYEVGSSWIASWVSWNWLQDLLSKYFAWKVRWKYRQYLWYCTPRHPAA